MSKPETNPSHKFTNFMSTLAICEFKELIDGKIGAVPVIIDLSRKRKNKTPKIGYKGWCEGCIRRCGPIIVTEILNNSSGDNQIEGTIVIEPPIPGEIPITSSKDAQILRENPSRLKIY